MAKAESILNGTRILAVDDEPDILSALEEEIADACPDCQVDKTGSYAQAVELLQSGTYDLVILDIMGVRGFALLEIALKRGFRVIMLTAHGLSSETLRISHDLGARAYVPKEKVEEIVPFLQDALTCEFHAGWKRAMGKLEPFFDELFESNWRSKVTV